MSLARDRDPCAANRALIGSVLIINAQSTAKVTSERNTSLQVAFCFKKMGKKNVNEPGRKALERQFLAVDEEACMAGFVLTCSGLKKKERKNMRELWDLSRGDLDSCVRSTKPRV